MNVKEEGMPKYLENRDRGKVDDRG